MPTILRIKGYRFFFFSNEGNEPCHIHIEKDNCYAKYWIDPVELVKSYSFDSAEINSIRKLVIANKKEIKRRWNEYFSK